MTSTQAAEQMPMASERVSQRAFFGASALLFVAAAALTILWCTSMAGMGEMPMPGGWSMSMVWMRLPGQTWPGAALAFVGMWVVMTAAMMLPSLVPTLWRYHQAAATEISGRRGALSALVGAGYFFVWTVFGVAAFPLGVGFAALAMQQPALSRAVPIAAGLVVLMAGGFQFTAWKARYLACCREPPSCARPFRPDTSAAWTLGIRLGFQCSCCCAGLTAALLTLGVMDLRVMTFVTAAVTLERLAPQGERAARAIGVAVLMTGVSLIARAAGPG